MSALGVKGVKELNRKLAALSAMDHGRVIRGAANKAGNLVMKRAEANVTIGSEPHRTYKGSWVSPGFLQRSIKKVSKLSRDKRTVWVRIGVKQEAFYGSIFVELGTSYQPARPWLAPALKDSKGEVVAIMREKILQHIKKIAAKR